MNVTYSDARNPRYSKEDNSEIILEVDFDHLDDDWVECTVMASGDMPHIHDLYAEAVAGDYGSVAAFSAPSNIDNTALTADQIAGGDMTAMDYLRAERDAKLTETDWWATSDRTMTSEQTTYRQALRDLPANSANCQIQFTSNTQLWGTWRTTPPGYEVWLNVTWPTKP